MSTKSDLYGLQPSTLFDDSFTFVYSPSETGLSATDQLYTARGAQAFGTLDIIISKWYMISDLDDYMSTILMKNTGYGRYNTYYKKRVLWTLKRDPDF